MQEAHSKEKKEVPMKKTASILIFALLLGLIASPAYAAKDIGIEIDGVAIKTDVKPETKNDRTMVPLRIVSESLAANVEWADPEVKLTKHNLNVILKANSKSAIINGKTVQMDVAPYLKNKRIYVPLRFLSEAFGYKVTYVSPTVKIETTPLLIDGKQVNAMQHYSRMTMGGILSEVSANAYIEAIYYQLEQSKGDEVKSPSEQDLDIDPSSFSMRAQYHLLDKDDNSILELELYSLNTDIPEKVVAPYPARLIHDVTTDKWYSYEPKDEDSLQQFFDMAEAQGFLVVLSNNAA